MPYKISVSIKKKRVVLDRKWNDIKSAKKQAHRINTNNPGYNARIRKIKPVAGSKTNVCVVCMGTGKIVTSKFLGFGYSHGIVKCARCKGTGKYTRPKERHMIAERKRREAIKKANIKRLKKK